MTAELPDLQSGISHLRIHEQEVVEHPPLDMRVCVARSAGEVDDL